MQNKKAIPTEIITLEDCLYLLKIRAFLMLSTLFLCMKFLKKRKECFIKFSIYFFPYKGELINFIF